MLSPHMETEFVKKILEVQKQENIILNKSMFADEMLLAKDWLTKEENEAWKDL